jgi:hypothetical protein
MAETEALAAIRSWGGLVIVDFDETLFLRNSTEEFLDCAVPVLPAAILLRLLDLCAPWRWTGGGAVRDVWRVRAILSLFPWTMRRWRARCLHMGDAINAPLLAALRERGEPFVIASAGFSRIIRPLLAHPACRQARLIACDVTRVDRLRGKLAAITETIGSQALAGALVLTDSMDDAEVLAACGQACLTQWHGAQFRRALRRVYLPGDYLVHVKRPKQDGAFRRLVTDDLALWMIMAAPGLNLRFLAGVAALFFSLWSVYEIGYWENDVCAVRLEADPVVSRQFSAFDSRWLEPKAWASASLLGFAGTLAIQPGSFVATAGAWATVLAGLRATYWIYNRIDKRTRVWAYMLLQLFRTLALAAVAPVAVLGMLAGVAQICARWQEYFWYRMAPPPHGFRWIDTPLRLIQLLFFLLCLGALAAAKVDVWTWRAAALTVWSVALARKDIRTALRSAQRLDSAARKRPRP